MHDLESNAVYGDIIPIPGFSEPLSSLTHLMAAVAILVASYWLLKPIKGRTWWRISVAVFVIGAAFLLSMSGTYHLLEPDGEPRAVLQRLDHAGIFVLIAATFTPVHIIAMRGRWRWIPLAFIWIGAISGLVLKTIFFHDLSEFVGLAFYLALGWTGVVSTYRLYKKEGWSPSIWMILGGLSYSAGAVLEFMRWPIIIPHVIGPHEIFHLGVIGGIACHARLIYQLSVIYHARSPLPHPGIAHAVSTASAPPLVAAPQLAGSGMHVGGDAL